MAFVRPSFGCHLESPLLYSQASFHPVLRRGDINLITLLEIKNFKNVSTSLKEEHVAWKILSLKTAACHTCLV